MAKGNKDVKRGIVLYIDGKEVQNNARAIQGEMRNLKREIDGCTVGSEEYIQKVKQYKLLDAELQRHKANLKGIETQNLANGAAVGSYVERLLGAVGMNGKFGRSLATLASGGAGGFFQGLTTNVKAFGATLTGLLANPAVLAVLGIGGAVAGFKWWYEYNKGLMEATRLTREFLDLHSEELVGVRSEIQAVADEWGKEYKEVLQTVDVLTKQYGIGAEEALRVVRDGLQAGADESGAMLRSMQQYAPIFKDMGLGASELAAVIAQTRSGIFNEQGLQMIQMADKRLREMSTGTMKALEAVGIDAEDMETKLVSGEKTLFEALQQVSGRLKDLPSQGREVGNVLKEVFGRNGSSGGLALVEELGKMTIEIEKVKEVTGEVGRLRDEHVEQQKVLNEEVAAMFDMTDQGFEEVRLSGRNYLTGVLIEVVKYARKTVDWFKSWYDENVALRAVVQWIGLAFQTLWVSLKTGVKQSMTLIENLGRSMRAVFDLKQLLDDPEAYWNHVVDTMKKGMSGYVGNLKSGLDEVVSAYEAAEKRVRNGRKGQGGQTDQRRLGDGSGEDGGGGGSTGGDGGCGGSTGGSRKGVKAADLVKQELAELELSVKKRQNVLRQSYVEGEIDKRKYNAEMERLEMERLQRMLEIAGLDPEKRAEIEGKVLELKMKTKEELDKMSFDKSADEDLKRYHEQTQKIEDELLDRISVIDSSLQLGIIAQEEYNEKIAEVWEKYDADMQSAHKAYVTKIREKKDETEEELSGLAKTFKEAGLDLKDLAEDIGESIGTGLAGALEGEMDTVKNALKSILNIIIDAIEKMVIAAEVESTLLTVTGIGTPIGLANLAKLVGIKIAFAALKESVNSFDVGGYTGIGRWDEPAGIVHKGEFVANRHALANPAVKAVLDVVDNAQRRGTVANLTSDDIRAVATPYHSDGYTKKPSVAAVPTRGDGGGEMKALMKQCIETMETVKERFDKPIVAETYATGRGGTMTAQELVEKMKDNASRKIR